MSSILEKAERICCGGGTPFYYHLCFLSSGNFVFFGERELVYKRLNSLESHHGFDLGSPANDCNVGLPEKCVFHGKNKYAVYNGMYIDFEVRNNQINIYLDGDGKSIPLYSAYGMPMEYIVEFGEIDQALEEHYEVRQY